MQTGELISIREYLSTSYRPDCDYVDGVVVELPALTAIAVVRRIQARYGPGVAMMVVTEFADTVRRVLPSMPVLRPDDVDDDLVSTIDLALVANQMRQTG